MIFLLFLIPSSSSSAHTGDFRESGLITNTNASPASIAVVISFIQSELSGMPSQSTQASICAVSMAAFSLRTKSLSLREYEMKIFVFRSVLNFEAINYFREDSTCDEPGRHVAFMCGVLDPDPLVIRADLLLTTRFRDDEFIVDRNALDQGAVVDHRLFSQRDRLRRGFDLDRTARCRRRTRGRRCGTAGIFYVPRSHIALFLIYIANLQPLVQHADLWDCLVCGFNADQLLGHRYSSDECFR